MSRQCEVTISSCTLSGAQRTLRCLAIALTTVYIGWQVFWLGVGQIPPSLFLALTGWPAATTGGTRSLVALLAGNWRLSIYHNPMMVPMAVLTLVSLCWILAQSVRGYRLRLPQPLVGSWVAVLVLAWVIKLIQA